MSERYYITTAIDYPNGSPHMGHAYEKIVTDFYARWNRCLKKDVRFLTGTDENGQKLIQAAEAAGKETLSYVDEQVQGFHKLCKDLLITNDDFIRTTEPRHHTTAQKFWNILKDKELIYFDKYAGQYCYSCETFYTETQAPDGNCPEHHKPLEEKKEEGYFFKLSEYQDFLIKKIEDDENFIRPARARKEVLSRLKSDDVRDLAISRPSAGWGVPIPDDEKYVMYTWFDALINYYSAIDTDELRETYWPADCHVIGKDIIWFHCVIWPAMLHALEIPLAKTVYVHGMVLAADGKKMSKSLNNGIDPNDMMAKYPVDSFRYYILRAIPSGGDGAFNEIDLQERHNTELGNDFGNLLMRVLKLSIKKLAPTMKANGAKQELDFSDMHKKFAEHANIYEHNRALDALWESIRRTNQYINESEPWKVKDDDSRLNEILYNCLHAIHVFAFHLQPVMPNICNEISKYLGQDLSTNPIGKFDEFTYELIEPAILFEKYELPKK